MLINRRLLNRIPKAASCKVFCRPQYCRTVLFVFISVIFFFYTLLMINWNTKLKASYTQHVRDNIRKLANNESVVWYQPSDGPIRPFVRINRKYLISKRYNFSIVQIPKVMSTAMFTSKCVLDHFEDLNHNLTREMQQIFWNSPVCEPRFEALVTPTIFTHLPARHSTLQIVREPLSRFVSAFVHLCIRGPATFYKGLKKDECFGCKDDLNCVVDKLYKDFVNISLTDGTHNKYYFVFLDRQWYRSHFYPQTWHGDLSLRYKNIQFIKYSSHGKQKDSMVNDLQTFFRETGVDDEKLKILEEYYRGSLLPVHTTRNLTETSTIRKKIFNSNELLDKIEKIYYYDFKVFGFDLPSQNRKSRQ